MPRRFQDHFPFHVVAVPGVQVVGQHGFDPSDFLVGQRGISSQVATLEAGQFREQGQQHRRVRIDDARQQLRGQRHPSHQHLLPQHLPGGSRGCERVLKPKPLFRTQHGAVRVAYICGKSGRVNAILGQVISVGQLLVAADDPCIQHVQVHQVAKAEAAGDGFLVSVRDRPDRHPFKVGTQCIEFAVTEITLIGVVVLSTVPPGVVGHFVVIPDRDERHLAVQLPQMIIAPVNRVAMAVILQSDELTVIRRGERTAHGFCLRGAIAIRVAVVLIEIIPQMQHGIQVIQARDFPIHVEVAGGVIGAGHHGEPHLAHRAFRKGLRHAGRGGASGGEETIVIALT